MKLNQALYEVIIGANEKDVQTDNWRRRTVMAKTATEAIDKAPFSEDSGEYVSSVKLVGRAD